MDVLLMIIYTTIILSVLVVIHEGGHYGMARAFGVRVTEFMIGLPGPNIGFTHKGTKFGITAVLLGGYARVCGMEAGEESPYLPQVLESVYARGTCNMEDVAADCNISSDDAYTALEELVEWGSITVPRKTDEFNTYRTPALDSTMLSAPLPGQGKKKGKANTASHATISTLFAGEPLACDEGQPRPVADVQAFYEAERAQTYRSLPFWKRSLILVAGPGVNLLFTIVVFVIIYSLIGVDIPDESGVVQHYMLSPLRSLAAGFNYIGMVFVAILGLFNPQTAAETVSNSTSIVGIAVLSKDAAEAGLMSFTMFAAMLSVSLGLMNMLPIPPLDGGRFLVEIYQAIRRKTISPRALNTLSMVGIMAFTLFFLFMLNQDVQRFVLGG